MASDGQWYPQMWEYKHFRWKHAVANPQELLELAENEANELGRQGWEMVNFPLNSMETYGNPARHTVVEWMVVCFVKRPRLAG